MYLDKLDFNVLRNEGCLLEGDGREALRLAGIGTQEGSEQGSLRIMPGNLCRGALIFL